MKIESNEIKSMTIEEFAGRNGLVMEVHERRLPVNDPNRFYAKFKRSDIRQGKWSLVGVFGNGPTPELAIADYARRIDLQTLVIDAMGKEEHEIEVPRLCVREGN